MGRLTERDIQGNPMLCMEGCSWIELLRKLAHYEDLEEQGRLIDLPCAVGDIVWTYDIAGGKSYIYEYRTPNEPMCILVKDLWGIKFFATKEEAEAKLKELEGVKE